MDIYWYWPYCRGEELAPAAGVIGAGDRLFVHTTPRHADPITSSPFPGCTVDASLPAVTPVREGSVRWTAERASTYIGRVRARRRVLASFTPDVCHVMYLNRFTDPWDLARIRRRVALVSSVHDVMPHTTRLPEPLERNLLRRLYRNAGHLVVHHDYVQRRLVGEFGVDPSRVHLVHLPVIRPNGPPETRSVSRPPTVLFFGTFRENKGIPVLLDAIDRLRRTEARFVFAGRGKRELEQQVSDAAGRDPRISVEIGYVTALRKQQLFGGASVVVLPYTGFASQSAVLHDAYARGVPVVVSDTGALGESVREDGTGWVVPPGDPEALAATLHEALVDEQSRERTTAATNVLAQERSPVLVGRRLRALYEQARADAIPGRGGAVVPRSGQAGGEPGASSP